LKSEKKWKIWKKGKLNSEMIWKIWKISVLVIITPKETSSSSAATTAVTGTIPGYLPLLFSYSVYIYRLCSTPRVSAISLWYF
jgi:hypothetical protein